MSRGRSPKKLRCIQRSADRHWGGKGPARTFSPVHVWDLRLARGPVGLALPDAYTTALVVLRGTLRPEGYEKVRESEVALFDRAGGSIRLEEAEDATALLLCGEPLGEPIVGHGPFVMNSREEIQQAIVDYQSGRMGHLSRASDAPG